MVECPSDGLPVGEVVQVGPSGCCRLSSASASACSLRSASSSACRLRVEEHPRGAFTSGALVEESLPGGLSPGVVERPRRVFGSGGVVEGLPIGGRIERPTGVGGDERLRLAFTGSASVEAALSDRLVAGVVERPRVVDVPLWEGLPLGLEEWPREVEGRDRPWLVFTALSLVGCLSDGMLA